MKRTQLGSTSSSNAQRGRDFEQRQRSAGRQRFQGWLDTDLLAAWQQQAAALALPASATRLDRFNLVLRRWYESATSTPAVDQRLALADKTPTKPAASSRYMPDAVEDRMLELLDSGLTLGEVGQRLGAEGVVSPTTGLPYDSRTVHRACERARRRRDSSRT